MIEFSGCPEEMYQFFWEIAFQNHREFFEANRDRYKRVVQEPMRALAAELLPTALSLNPSFNQRVTTIVSRIRRDTRYSHDKSPYRDHVWLAFKPAEKRTSECFVVYAEFERDHYGYGMGMYAPDTTQMNALRARMLTQPKRFLSLVEAPAFVNRFSVEGELYRRPKFRDCSAELSPWLNRKSLTFCYTSSALSKTYSRAIVDELIEAFTLLRPVYRFLMGLD